MNIPRGPQGPAASPLRPPQSSLPSKRPPSLEEPITAEAARRAAGGSAKLTNESDKESPAGPTKKWQRRRDARPKELISAALELFAQRGFAATRLEEVAAKAGVSKATVYLYFKNKEDLFEAVVREFVTGNLDQAEELVKVFHGPTADLLRTMVAFFEHRLEGPMPVLFKLMVAESGNFPKLAQLWADLGPRRGLALIQRILQRGIDRKELRPFATQHVAPLVVAPIFILALWKQVLAPHTDFRLEPHEILAEHVETLIRGLAANGSTAAGKKNDGTQSPKAALRPRQRRRR